MVVFWLFISSSVGNVYAQSNTDIKKSDDAEHAQLPPKAKYEAASESETKNIRPATGQTLSPVRSQKAMDSPSNETLSHPGNEAVLGAPDDTSDKADCCKAHTCCQ